MTITLTEFFEIGFIGKYLNSNISFFMIGVVLSAAIAYLLGSLNFAIIISGKTYKQDIRQYGSKNAGMTNMMRTYGGRAAGLTLLGDALKAIVAGFIGYALIGQLGAYIAGCACVIGHMFPIFYGFKGGKGVVTTAASILVCNPYVFLIIILLYVAIVAMSKYISLASIMCALMYPFILNGIDTWLVGGCPYVPFALLSAVLVLFKHRENFKRLREGKENKFSFKKSVKAPKDQEEKGTNNDTNNEEK